MIAAGFGHNLPVVRVALDVMGGDDAPVAALEGVAEILRTTTIDLLLVGPPALIHKHLPNVDSKRVEVLEAGEWIRAHRSVRDEIQEKPRNTMALAMQAVQTGDADALVSAGPTGALVLLAAEHLRRIEGVKRTALAAVHPTRDRSFNNDRFALILDVGATIRCDADALYTFGRMGHAYASSISKVPSPAIGLLNMGEEPTKGDEILQSAYQLLHKDPALNFIGNVEGTDIPLGVADVVVCEGFVGNVVLKMAEGMGEVFQGLGAWAFKRHLTWRLGMRLLSDGLQQLKSITDYREYGGAPFLGFEKMVIKAHGRSGPHAIANAVKVAAKAARDDVCGAITQAVAT